MRNITGAKAEAVALVAQAAGDLFEHLGYRPVVGKVWSVLILSLEPLDAFSIREALSISSGALSMAINELIELKLVFRETIEDKRHFFYRAEKDLLIIATHIFRERERKKLMAVLSKIKRAEQLMKEASQKTDTEEEISYKLDQLRRLAELGEFVIGLVDALLERTKVELKATRKWLSVSGKLGGESLSRIRRAINASRFGKRITH